MSVLNYNEVLQLALQYFNSDGGLPHTIDYLKACLLRKMKEDSYSLLKFRDDSSDLEKLCDDFAKLCDEVKQQSANTTAFEENFRIMLDKQPHIKVSFSFRLKTAVSYALIATGTIAVLAPWGGPIFFTALAISAGAHPIIAVVLAIMAAAVAAAFLTHAICLCLSRIPVPWPDTPSDWMLSRFCRKLLNTAPENTLLSTPKSSTINTISSAIDTSLSTMKETTTSEATENPHLLPHQATAKNYSIQMQTHNFPFWDRWFSHQKKSSLKPVEECTALEPVVMPKF